MILHDKIIKDSKNEKSKGFNREYYLCLDCNLTFKNLRGAIGHKINTLHKIIQEHFPTKGYHLFPPFELQIKEKYLLPLTEKKAFPVVGEPDEIWKGVMYYRCLTCGLEFKKQEDAIDHSIKSLHKIIIEVHPMMGRAYTTEFWPVDKSLAEIIGSNIDYDTFCQRTTENIPDED